jgi:N-acylneuraminate cytidylyltransferase/CMP-N,N'-diacetyllegionaminic acid synthase
MTKKLNIICIITARSGSKGLKNKNIRRLKGLPLLAHTIIAAKKTKILTRVILSTDSKLYAKIGLKFGAEIPFIRPKKLASAKAHHPDVVNHALKFVEKKEQIKFDYVMMLQPTSPFRKSKHINEAIKKFLKENNDSLISVKKQDYPPWWLFSLKKNKLSQFLKFKNKNVFNLERQEFPNLFRPNGAIYVSKRNVLNTGNLINPKSCGYYLMDEMDSIDIDNLIDLKVAESI